MKDRSDVTGLWVGCYHYTLGGREPVSFIANLDEASGAVTGRITEPNTITGTASHLSAAVDGSRRGDQLRFIKTYTGEVTHSIRYAGKISADGRQVLGAWEGGAIFGSFEMNRELLEDDEAVTEDQAIATAGTAVEPD